MERKEFIKTCGFACVGGTLLGAILQGCNGSKIISAEINHSDMVVPLAAFRDSNSFKKHVVVQNQQLKYPICVYRFSETAYTALLMRCTHQGAELQVFGDRLECPAHGSQFSSTGQVKNGPADANLRTFPITIANDQILISLK
ncbi:nitrite reductase/ring-hydroxylating ferredoxin subunit [Mucilaginibacter frigoritolerans]|uniref:Nitrite reductase/ring-hydroxylating ferredoxin subunit n=1 Tax=Mucilaginibacter frigoritolerans TaxID=652788 RepID=A0A562TU50_9SPHI|nr:Rieske 2Fe-2S domain-containing protein [Mucilaginibacter frigoritolerans]TWI96734.1 nitrite reductase/ring-hydroxylating ferredoxin subunit [Mucilaginibacter frigoritolerans]